MNARIAPFYSSGSDFPDRVWVYLPGRIGIARDNDLPESKLIAWAEIYWQNADAEQAREAQLRADCPGRQIFSGQLPDHDVEWNGAPGHYLYCLKDRRRHGKYQVLKAI